jgi:hypothetical protein
LCATSNAEIEEDDNVALKVSDAKRKQSSASTEYSSPDQRDESSPFYTNHVAPQLSIPSMTSNKSIDLFAWSHPQGYQDGDIMYMMTSKPTFGWAFKNQSSGRSSIVM